MNTIVFNNFRIYKKNEIPDNCIARIIVLISNTAYCPHCVGIKVTRKEDSGRVARWNCGDGKFSFNVLSGAIIKLRGLTERAIGRCFGVQLAKLKRVLTSAVLLLIC